MIKVAPSILSADFSKLGEEIIKIDQAGADMIHIDVMDGHFVPNLTLGAPIVKALRTVTKLPFDVHLMINNPENLIDDFIAAGADIITIHIEAANHLHRLVQKVKSSGVKVAVSLNPATPLNTLEEILPELDMVLLMSVNPGFGGQKYIPYCGEKVRELRKMITEKNLDVDIQVDGGVKASNIAAIAECGANIFVCGSAVFEGDIQKNVKEILEQMNK